MFSIREREDVDIKIHEQTLEKREELFVEYLENVGFHAEPILALDKLDIQENQN